jgi:hypothetical protein
VETPAKLRGPTTTTPKHLITPVVVRVSGVVAVPRDALVRLRALRILYEQTEDGKLYAWNKLMELLVDNGMNINYSRLLLWDFYILGLLERPRTGLYKVNRDRLKAYIEEYEAKLARMKARGGSGGQAPSQG